MSAPWEVLLLPEQAHDNRRENYLIVGDALTRYLRADLTCGECAKFMRVECPKDALCGRNGTLELACMAFVPKEGR